MGCGGSKDTTAGGGGGRTAGPPPGNTPAQMKNQALDRELELAREEEERKVKMLLLGAGESGKSTIFKQMRVLYGTPLGIDDLRMYGVVVRSNALTAIRKLVSRLRDLGLVDALDAESAEMIREAEEDGFDAMASGDISENGDENGDGSNSDENGDGNGGGSGGIMTPRKAYDELIAYLVDNTATAPPQDANGAVKDWVGESPRAGQLANKDAKQFMQHVDAIRTLWRSKTMEEVWEKRAAVNVVDSHRKFLDDITRVTDPTYKPTSQDVILARVRSTQVVMERYRIDGINFEMYDVGGQRSERRKWIDCFDHVDAVIFVAALSEYDQTLAEAKRTNRMIEALELFKSVVNNRIFEGISIMLFLNKKDIFAEKIMYSDINAVEHFADYSGPPKDFDHGVMYFTKKFKDCLTEGEFNDSFIHVTCATDRNNMEFVLDSTRTIIMTDNLMRSGFLGSE